MSGVKKLKYIAIIKLILILFHFQAFGSYMDELQKIENLQDKTNLLLAKYPSMGMGIIGIYDSRIKFIAQQEKESFKITIQPTSKPQTLILVNARKWTGFFWWKEPKQLEVSISKLDQIRQGKTSFSPKEIKFISEL